MLMVRGGGTKKRQRVKIVLETGISPVEDGGDIAVVSVLPAWAPLPGKSMLASGSHLKTLHTFF